MEKNNINKLKKLSASLDDKAKTKQLDKPKQVIERKTKVIMVEGKQLLSD